MPKKWRKVVMHCIHSVSTELCSKLHTICQILKMCMKFAFYSLKTMIVNLPDYILQILHLRGNINIANRLMQILYHYIKD